MYWASKSDLYLMVESGMFVIKCYYKRPTVTGRVALPYFIEVGMSSQVLMYIWTLTML